MSSQKTIIHKSKHLKEKDSCVFSKAFLKERDTLIFIIEMLNKEVHYRLISSTYSNINNENIYIKKHGTLEDNINKLKTCNCKEEIFEITTNITYILSYQMSNIMHYDYTPLIEFLYKNSYNNINNPKIEANFENEEVNICMNELADKIIQSNINSKKDLEFKEIYQIDNISKLHSIVDLYKINIDNEINIIKKEIPRKISFVIDLITSLIKLIF
jgi:hypothetical protein